MSRCHFATCLPAAEGAAFRHVVVTQEHEIYGVLRINTGLRRAVSQGAPDITLGTLAQRNFIVVQEKRRCVRRHHPALETARDDGGRGGATGRTRPGLACSG